ncbi:FadR/GntR family transcriptional regulator [Streptomyces fuscigenes]|uniref:FadR/GntR family transcriptional regulator n=1 Tax=Streptomyces fuscigenes TaxID=1528880 RepID=UPI001F26E72E|nr:FadR/GntR family transcriptional regulator [Streptomyces fuscigenes]MCF3963839.1 FadR family transcriptional regulator [Streptomyces fuscigenes]
MPIRAAERSSLVDRVIEQLQSLIESGEWQVGTKIPAEPVLTEMLGVGRNTVREAVRALGHSGMLEPRQGDGTYVRASDALGAALHRRLRRAGHLEAMEVRSGLERDAARLAASRRDEEDLAALRSALAARTAAWLSGDTDAFVRADVAFHRAVVAAAHNGMLADLYSHLTDGLHRAIASVADAPLPDPRRSQADSHADLLAAIERGDPAGATEAVAHYIDDSVSSLRALQDADPLPEDVAHGVGRPGAHDGGAARQEGDRS